MRNVMLLNSLDKETVGPQRQRTGVLSSCPSPDSNLQPLGQWGIWSCSRRVLQHGVCWALPGLCVSPQRRTPGMGKMHSSCLLSGIRLREQMKKGAMIGAYCWSQHGVYILGCACPPWGVQLCSSAAGSLGREDRGRGRVQDATSCVHGVAES